MKKNSKLAQMTVIGLTAAIAYTTAAGFIGGCGKKAAAPADPAAETSASPSPSVSPEASASPDASPSPTAIPIETAVIGTWISGCNTFGSDGTKVTWVFGAASLSHSETTYQNSLICAPATAQAPNVMTGTYEFVTDANGVTGAKSINATMTGMSSVLFGIAEVVGDTLYIEMAPVTRSAAFGFTTEALKEGATAGGTNMDTLSGTWLSGCSNSTTSPGTYYKYQYTFVKTGTLTGTVSFTSSSYGTSSNCTTAPTNNTVTGTVALDGASSYLYTDFNVGRRPIGYTWLTGTGFPGGFSTGYNVIQVYGSHYMNANTPASFSNTNTPENTPMDSTLYTKQ